MILPTSQEQRTQKYNQIFAFLQTHPNVTVFTCSAGGEACALVGRRD